MTYDLQVHSKSLLLYFSTVDEARGLKSIQGPIPASQMAYSTLWAPSIAGYGGERQSAHITISISVLSKAVMVQSYYWKMVLTYFYLEFSV